MRTARLYRYEEPLRLEHLTGSREVEAVVDCDGAEEFLALGFSVRLEDINETSKRSGTVACRGVRCSSTTVTRCGSSGYVNGEVPADNSNMRSADAVTLPAGR